MKTVKMTKKEFVKEHTELTEVLKSGNKAGLKRELKEQSSELKKVKRKL